MVGCDGVESYTLAITTTEGGSVTTPGEGTFPYSQGTVVNLTGEAEAGHRFVNWTGNVSTIANVNAISTNITMNNSYSIMANFEEIPTVQYQLAINSTEGGNVATPGEGLFTYDEGTAVNLVAEAEECYRFVDWTGDVPTLGNVTAAITTTIVNGDYCITANFEEEVVAFPDPNLETAIREAITKPDGPIYACDLKGFTVLGAAGCNISDLTGLEYCTHLTNLDIDGNKIANISPLTNLVNLNRLDLKGNQIADVSALVNLINLQSLDLSYNEISNISAVGNLTNLTSLGLKDNQISDISALANLTNLTGMALGFNQISDISPLANLTSLTGLSSPYNEISNISYIGNLTNLQDLDFAHNQIIDISPLVNLISLRWIALSSNQISDIEPLVDNSGLADGDDVYLNSNPLSETSINTYIPQLEARGVTVYY